MHLLKKNIHLLSHVLRLVHHQLLLHLEALPTDAAQKRNDLRPPFLLRHFLQVSRAMSLRGETVAESFAAKLTDRLHRRFAVAGVSFATVSLDLTRGEGFLADWTDVDGFKPEDLLELNHLAVLWAISNTYNLLKLGNKTGETEFREDSYDFSKVFPKIDVQ